MTQMLRYKLAEAIARINPAQTHNVDPHMINGWAWNTVGNWTEEVKEAAAVAFMRDFVAGPDVDLLRRAMKQITQAGSIQWDEPEDDAERAAEQPYLGREQSKQAEVERRALVRQKGVEAKRPHVLTEKEKLAISSPNYDFPRLKKKVGVYSWIQYIPPEILHRPSEWGLVMYSAPVNTMIRHGILTVVEPHPTHVNASVVRTGPQYERFLAMAGLKPRPHAGHLVTRVHREVQDLGRYDRVAMGIEPPRFPH